jgi:hypothetical protein
MTRALLVLFLFALAASPQALASTRILYASDWSGPTEIYAVTADGRSTAQITAGTPPSCRVQLIPCGFLDPLPSPDGRRLLYRGTDGSLWLSRGDGRSPRELSSADQGAADWSRDSRRVAYAADDGIHVAHADGSGDRLVAPGLSGAVAWSSDGRGLLAYTSAGELYESRNGTTRRLLTTRPIGGQSVYDQELVPSPNKHLLAVIGAYGGAEVVSVRPGHAVATPLGVVVGAAAWAPDSRQLAAVTPRGLRIYSVRTRRSRLVTRATGYTHDAHSEQSALGVAWQPRGSSLAYVQGGIAPFDGDITSGGLRVTSPSGRARTLVSSGHAFGGRMLSVAWAPSPPGLRYRHAPAAPLRRTTPTDLLAPGPISALAADGSRVAFVSCQSVYAWTPATGDLATVAQTGPPSSCTNHTNFTVYDVALAGERVLYAQSFGCNVITQSVRLKLLDRPAEAATIAQGNGNCGGPYHPFVGDLAGTGDLLVFGSSTEGVDFSKSPTEFITTREGVEQVGAAGCPCAEIASSPGPLVPADVDAGRVVAFGDNETLLLDRDGHVLLSVPVAPTAAQLSQHDLVVLLPGALRDYDATSGSLLHTWSLPDVANGRGCWLRCPDERLVLEDASDGLVAYTLNGAVHLLRLADGADKVVGPGVAARFLDAGLVYAQGARLHIVRYAKLPLRGF